MTDIDEAMLIAWVDGELDEVSRRRVDRAIAEDPALAERLEMHVRLRNRLSSHYAPIEAEPVPQALQDMVGQSAKVTPLFQTRSRRWGGWAMGGAIAASLVLGLGIGRFSGGPTGPVEVRQGVMVAKGDLASALDSQLASAQEGAALRIGVSFQRKGGGWCRSFDGSAVAGVACREGNAWQVQQLVPSGGQATSYRQAASTDSRVMATVDALIDGAPADAGQEAAAKANGWR